MNDVDIEKMLTNSEVTSDQQGTGAGEKLLILLSFTLTIVRHVVYSDLAVSQQN